MDFIKKEQYTIKGNKELTLESMFDMARAISIYLFEMDWQFCYSSKSSFITSDNPFVLIPPSDYKKKEGIYGLGILVPGVKKIVPLTQKVCLVICDKGDKIEKTNVSSKEVREINCYIAKNYNNFLISRDKILLEKIVKNISIDRTKVKSKVDVFQQGNLIIARRRLN